MRLRRLGRQLRAAESAVRLPGGFQLPARSCVVSLESGPQLIISPLAGMGRLREEILVPGKVLAILAPNALHHPGLEEAHATFPHAALHAVERVQRKYPELPFARALGSDDLGGPWRGELDCHPIEGMPGLNEVALLHRPSRSLLVFDLLFNLVHLPHAPTRWLLQLMGSFGAPTMSPLVRRRIRDPKALRRSVARLLDLQFERLVPAHGEIIEHDARTQLQAAFAFLPA